MLTGKAARKLVMSFNRRRIRLGITHHGAASSWSAPSKDDAASRGKPPKGKRR